MIKFFKKGANTYYAVDSDHSLTTEEIKKLTWLFDGAQPSDETSIKGVFVGPRKEMITPWSTNAVEITQNMGINGIARIEEFLLSENDKEPSYDRMLQRVYHGLDESVFTITKSPDPIVYIDDIEKYNETEGLALNPEEIKYLNDLSSKIGRPLTDIRILTGQFRALPS